MVDETSESQVIFYQTDIKEFLITAADGKHYKTKMYGLGEQKIR